MAVESVVPELKEILGAILFAAKKPVTAAEMLAVLKTTAKEEGGATEAFASLKQADVDEAITVLRQDLERAGCGFVVGEVAGGFRLENEVGCGPWLRQYLQRGRSNRLTRPALETLAIIAYRQPCTRSEIESVRGVAVDQIVRNLLEMQLVRIAGRSDLPGRPWLFGTTQKFLEHFGLSGIAQLPGVEELRRMEEQRARQKAAEQAQAAEAPDGEPVGEPAAPEAAPPAVANDEEEALESRMEEDQDLYDEDEDEDEDEYDDEDEDEEEDDID